VSARLILLLSVSLDGFAAQADGTQDWHAPDGGPDDGDQRHRMNLELLGQAGTIVLGRRAYEEMAPAWSASDSPMARLMNGLPKVVFSSTLAEATWSGSRILRGPVQEEVPALKEGAERDLVVVGGARIAHSLMCHRLIDEHRLTVHPVALGAGLPLMHGLPEPPAPAARQQHDLRRRLRHAGPAPLSAALRRVRRPAPRRRRRCGASPGR
jgi:dihydrofolate reductase